MSQLKRVLTTALAAAILSVGGVVHAQKVQLQGVVVSQTAIQKKVLWDWAAEEIKKRSNGEMEITITSMPELGLTGFELVRVLGAGLVDLADVLPTYVAGDIPVIEGGDLLGIFKNYDTAVKGHLAWEKVLRDKYSARLGSVVLGSWPWSQQMLYSKRDVKTMDDYKGMRIRVFSPAMAQFVSALGAEPVSLPYAEVYTALDRGTIDGAITCALCGWEQKLHEVTDYLLDAHMGTAVTTLFVVSNKTWAKLNDKQKAILSQLGAEFTERGWSFGSQWAEEGIRNLTGPGKMKLSTVPAERAPIENIVKTRIGPWWAKRAGAEPTKDWNDTLGPIVGFTIAP